MLGWPAKDTAALLESSVASANSAVQRARTTLRSHLPVSRLDWAPSTEPTEPERAVLRRYMDAVERADLAAVADLLADEVRSTMPPYPVWFQGRDAVLAALAKSWDPVSPAYVGQFQMIATQANRQPAAAAYVRRYDESVYRAFAIAMLRIEKGQIMEITAFHDPDQFSAFGLSRDLAPVHR